MYLPRNATIEESCEWMEAKTGEKWTLPRLLEEAHLTPHVWIDHIPGYPKIFGERLEGYLTKMIFHGDVMRLAADRADALITMFPAHDGSLIKVSPGWRVALKDVRFNGQALERAAEILNGAKPAPEQASPAPVAPSASDAPVVAETVAQRRARWLDMFEAEEKREKRGALARLAKSEGFDRANMSKDIGKARAARDTEKRAGMWTAQLVQDGKRKG